MRLLKSLLMLLMLVTFSTGFGKTTTDLKQNSKTEFVTADLFSLNNDFVTVVPIASHDALIVTSSVATLIVQDKNIKLNNFAIITDVGWRKSQRQFKEIAYNEKLLDNQNTKTKIKFSINLNNRIRKNPFKNDSVILIKRYV